MSGVSVAVRRCASGELVVSPAATVQGPDGAARPIAATPCAALRDEGVAALDPTVDAILGAGMQAQLDIPADVPDRLDAAEAVAAWTLGRAPRERDAMIVCTWSLTCLVVVGLRDPEMRRGLRVNGPLRRSPRGALGESRRPSGIFPRHELCTPERVRRWRAAHLFVAPWTVSDPSRAAALLDMGADLVLSRDPGALQGSAPPSAG